MNLCKIVCENYFIFCDYDNNVFILFCIIDELNICTISGLKLGLVVSILLIKFLSYNEYCWGILTYEPLTIFNAKNCKLFAVNGGVNVHI